VRLSDHGSIETDRLLLRRVRRADLPALLAVHGDDEVTRYLPYASWRSMRDARNWYGRMEKLQADGTALIWSVIERLSGTAIGTCLLFRFDATSARAELGYVLGRAHWRQGCMHEALRALIASVYKRMPVRRLEAEVDTRNPRSAELLGSLGFTREGLLRQRWVSKGEAKDVEVFGLLRHEWAQQQVPGQAERKTGSPLARKLANVKAPAD
jgi:ribosomal-protein-alanine N-acetyltransferase